MNAAQITSSKIVKYPVQFTPFCERLCEVAGAVKFRDSSLSLGKEVGK